MSEPRRDRTGRWRGAGRWRLFSSLKAEILLSLAVMGMAALSLAALNVVVLQDIVAAPHGTAYLALLIVADVIIFVAFGAYKVQGLVLDPLEAVVETTEAIAAGDLTRRVPPGSTSEFARLSHSVNRMTSRLLEEQAQRIHLEKVASIGRLAAGVAHEIGNPLGAIAGYTHLLRRAIARADGEACEALAGIERETARIDRIVRGLLDYARPRRRTLEPVSLNAIVHRAIDLLRNQGTLRRVTPRLTLDPDLPVLDADAHELEQVLVNLLLNAVDAMEGAGTVTVVTEAIPFAAFVAPAARRTDDPGYAVAAREASARVRAWLGTIAEPRQIIALIVADTGPGIPWSESERIFDPFYTTKEPGKGTGLGLAIVSRIVEGLGGTIWVRPAREGGAAFVAYFPVPDAAGRNEPTPPDAGPIDP
jgi:two-component system NtrC family sensor kinase